MLHNQEGGMDHMDSYYYMGMHMFFWAFLVIVLLLLLYIAIRLSKRK